MTCSVIGCRVIRGYRQARLMPSGRYIHKSFGKDSRDAHNDCHKWIADARNEIRAGRLGFAQRLHVKSFAEAARLYFGRWSNEKDAEGKIAHRASKEAGRVIEVNLVPHFGKTPFESIRPIDIQRWRESRLRKVIGTSVNREQAVLSSIFSHIERWAKTEAIPAFKIPAENPCKSVEKAPNRKRKRVLTMAELAALKRACFALNDPDLWEICGMAWMSALRKKDLFRLESGTDIEMVQAKTGRGIKLPVSVERPLRYENFRRRWEAARKAARLEDCQFRDIRKSAATFAKMKGYSTKLISEFLGHASTDTTETYLIKNAEHLRPLAKDLEEILKGL